MTSIYNEDMEKSELRKRLEDLQYRCERSASPVASLFLSPAEVVENQRCGAYFTGGYDDAERKIAIFIPEWMSEEDVDTSSYLNCLKIQSFFGVPTHRDYMGSILGLGISRDRIGDIVVDGDCARVVCLPSVTASIKNELSKVGRISVKVSEVALDELQMQQKKTRVITFTVKSMRLDAIAADMFGMSRTSAAEAIRQGLVCLNYVVNEKTDATVKENDIISIRGKGKGRIFEIGGKSRRDRIFVSAEIYI